MGRSVITETDVKDALAARDSAGRIAAGDEANIPPADDYNARLVKYIPGEIVSVYLCVSGALLAASGQIPSTNFKTLQWGIFGFLLIMTPFYLRHVLNVKKKQQLAIVTLSFAIWVFTLGGPFIQFNWYHPIYGAVLLPLYTFTIAIMKARS